MLRVRSNFGVNAFAAEHASPHISWLCSHTLENSASHVKSCTCNVDTALYHEGDARIHSDPIRSCPIQSQI